MENTPRSAAEPILLAAVIRLTFVLWQLGHRIAVAIGCPQLIQAPASDEIGFPQAGHEMRGMVAPWVEWDVEHSELPPGVNPLSVSPVAYCSL